MNDNINTDTLLPVGERLKPLLNKSCISESDMKALLAERGVYIGDSNKRLSIPILTLSILSPKEFEKLQELQKTKEDSLKTRITKTKSQSDNNLNNLIPQDLIKKDELLDELFSNFILKILSFTLNFIIDISLLASFITFVFSLTLS